MNKSELVDAIAQGASLTKTEAKAALEAAIEAVAGALEKGEKVTLVGFGAFSVVEKAARAGVNPATGAKIEIEAKKVVKFKVGAELAEKVK